MASNPVNVSCRVCGGRLSALSARPRSSYDRLRAYSILYCLDCGHGETSPVPTKEELDRCYSGDYGYEVHRAVASEKRWRARRLVRLSGAKKGFRCIDVGSMYGFLLTEALNLGAGSAVGVELSLQACEESGRRGIKALQGNLEDHAEDLRGDVDFIFAQHALEHLPEVSLFLKTAAGILRPGGRLVLAVPNFGGIGRRVAGSSWGWYQTPVHLHHFSDSSLTHFLENSGLFKVEKVRRRGGDTLFLVMTLFNLLSQAFGRDTVPTRKIRPWQEKVLGVVSYVARYFYWLGDDELILVAKLEPRTQQ